MIVDVRIDPEGHIQAIGLDARACALGQASAALLAQYAIGRTAAEMEIATQALSAFLRAGHADSNFWPGMDVLACARDYPARHPSILLSFEAASEAAADAMRVVRAS
jgi:NifU-like protein involved in Fe-S cluster formation